MLRARVQAELRLCVLVAPCQEPKLLNQLSKLLNPGALKQHYNLLLLVIIYKCYNDFIIREICYKFDNVILIYAITAHFGKLFLGIA